MPTKGAKKAAADKAVAHPLRRKSIRPSSSTVRGMLPGPQFRALDAAMQSLRAEGFQLDWAWRDASTGWVCECFHEDHVVGELVPTEDPLLGRVRLSKTQLERALPLVPKNYRPILENPVDTVRGLAIFEFPLVESRMRDLYSSFLDALRVVFEAEEA